MFDQRGTMKYRKKLYIKIVVSLSVFCIVMLLFLLFKKGKKYPFTYSESSQYIPIADGELLELTGDGGVFRYSNTGRKTLLLESSDIQHLSVLYEEDGVYTLSVHKDGLLALGKDFSFEEKRIASLEGVKKAGLQFNGIVVLTERGEVYEGTIPGTLADFYEDVTGDVELVKVENMPEIADMSVTKRDNVCLTKKGEIWAKGEFYENRYENYTEIIVEVPMQQISNAGSTILALDEEGTIYEVGMVLDEKGARYNNEQFTKVLTYGKAVQIYGSGDRAVVYNEKGTIRFFGYICRGKGYERSWGGKVRGLKNVRQVFIRGEYIYVLCEDCLYIRKEPLSKRF